MIKFIFTDIRFTTLRKDVQGGKNVQTIYRLLQAAQKTFHTRYAGFAPYLTHRHSLSDRYKDDAQQLHTKQKIRSYHYFRRGASRALRNENDAELFHSVLRSYDGRKDAGANALGYVQPSRKTPLQLLR